MIIGRDRPAPRRRRAGRLHIDLSLCGLLLFLCPNGDFGRVRPSLVTPADDIHAWIGRDAARDYGAPVSLFPLTDDERLLRDLAYPLIELPYDRQRWYSVLGEYGISRAIRPEWYECDPTAYAARLMTGWARSETARYSRLNEDIRNDILRIDPFFAVARRVVDIDRKREKSLAYVSVLSEGEVANARSRVGENLLTVGWVQRALIERSRAYRFALERLIVVQPSPAAIEIDRSLTLLQARIDGNVVVATPDFATAASPPPVPLPRRRAVVSK
jgi:hypothetical protein